MEAATIRNAADVVATIPSVSTEFILQAVETAFFVVIVREVVLHVIPVIMDIKLSILSHHNV